MKNLGVFWTISFKKALQVGYELGKQPLLILHHTYEEYLSNFIDHTYRNATLLNFPAGGLGPIWTHCHCFIK